MGQIVDYLLSHVLEPALHWTLNHPFISLVVVGALVYFSCRNYRML
jgi:hypothetical protein